MRTRCAASTLVADVLGRRLREVARTPVSVHYETGDDRVPVLCAATPAAVRLPNSVVVNELPADPPDLVVTRWWRPLRPTGLAPPDPDRLAGLAVTSYDVLSPDALVGRGPGLTPEGDDVLAGALVAAHATNDPRRGRLVTETRRALESQTTTVVSRALLAHAIEGFAIPELAGMLTALSLGGDPGSAAARLRAVGHTSGQAVLDGVVHVLSTAVLEPRQTLSSREGAA